MATTNYDRNEIRLTNSDAKCLMENWVEEVCFFASFCPVRVGLSAVEDSWFEQRKMYLQPCLRTLGNARLLPLSLPIFLIGVDLLKVMRHARVPCMHARISPIVSVVSGKGHGESCQSEIFEIRSLPLGWTRLWQLCSTAQILSSRTVCHSTHPRSSGSGLYAGHHCIRGHEDL